MSHRARVCLIDDDVVILGALALALREAGYEVMTAPGAAAGLDLVERGRVDAIVTDMNMPGTSGAELISEARAKWPDLPIIAMSGSITADGGSMLDIARKLGANALLSKPFRCDALGEVLAAALTPRTG